jgi:hypothetical protein
MPVAGLVLFAVVDAGSVMNPVSLIVNPFNVAIFSTLY